MYNNETTEHFPGMEEVSCDRKEVMQDLVGDISNYFVYEGPFGRVRARNKDFVRK